MYILFFFVKFLNSFNFKIYINNNIYIKYKSINQ